MLLLAGNKVVVASMDFSLAVDGRLSFFDLAAFLGNDFRTRNGCMPIHIFIGSMSIYGSYGYGIGHREVKRVN